MYLMVKVDYLYQEPKSGIYKYRRRVPKELQLALGKELVTISLKTKNPEVARSKHARVHEEIEERFQRAAEKSPKTIKYEATLTDLKSSGLVDDEADRFAKVSIEDAERHNAHTGALLGIADAMTPKQLESPLNPNGKFERLLRAQLKGLEKPRLTIREAQRLYMDFNKHRDTAVKLKKDTERVVQVLSIVMDESDPTLHSINRKHALAFRDHLLKQNLSPATVARRITTIRAIISRIIKEGYEEGIQNFFESVDVPNYGESSAKEKRAALTVEEIKQIVPYLATKNSDMRDIWVMLTYSGARVAEISGLLWEDIYLDDDTPHFVIRGNENRRIKNLGSKRSIPLVGAALKTVHTRVVGGNLSSSVFPKYSGPNGPNTVSAMMVKCMKQAAVWEKTRKVPHSLRHSHEDWMRRTTASDLSDLIHGRSNGSVSGNYGSDKMLDLLQKALVETLKVSGVDKIEFPWLD